eukprot:gene1621-1961_t
MEFRLRHPVDHVTPRDPQFRLLMSVGANMIDLVATKLVLRPSNLSNQVWVVDPEYYWFKHCECNSGFTPDHNETYMFWCNLTTSAWDEFNVNATCINMAVLTCSESPKKQLTPTQVAMTTVFAAAAKYDNCGSTVQQEGDSYTLVFHTAFDAVAFCLQAQQALMEVSWPEGLMGGDEQSSVGPKSSSRRRLKLPDFEGMSLLRSGAGSVWRSRGKNNVGRYNSSAKVSKLMSTKASGSSVPQSGLEYSPSELAAATAAVVGGSSTHASIAAASQQGQQRSAATAGSLVGYRGGSRSRMRDFFLQSSSGESNTLFNGLRVRMGVVTGEIDRPAEAKEGNALANIMNSMLYKLALGSLTWRHDLAECDEALVLDMGEFRVPALPPKIHSMATGTLNNMMRASMKIPMLLLPKADPSPQPHWKGACMGKHLEREEQLGVHGRPVF